MRRAEHVGKTRTRAYGAGEPERACEPLDQRVEVARQVFVPHDRAAVRPRSDEREPRRVAAVETVAERAHHRREPVGVDDGGPPSNPALVDEHAARPLVRVPDAHRHADLVLEGSPVQVACERPQVLDLARISRNVGRRGGSRLRRRGDERHRRVRPSLDGAQNRLQVDRRGVLVTEDVHQHDDVADVALEQRAQDVRPCPLDAVLLDERRFGVTR